MNTQEVINQLCQLEEGRKRLYDIFAAAAESSTLDPASIKVAEMCSEALMQDAEALEQDECGFQYC